MTHQQLLEQANRKVRSNTNRQFARKSSDAQMLERLTAAARKVLDNIHPVYGALDDVGMQAFDELRTATRLAELRPK